MSYHIVPLKEWSGFEGFMGFQKKVALDDKSRLILTSSGSLTRLLENGCNKMALF